jgi:hypothetical protein
MSDGRRNAELVQQYRARLRAKGLRPVQLWLPDTSTPEFAAQVAHDIAVLKAAEEAASPDERAMWDAWERASVEGLPAWTGPDLSNPDDKA